MSSPATCTCPVLLYLINHYSQAGWHVVAGLDTKNERPLKAAALCCDRVQGVNYQSLVFPGETHNELAWRKRLHLPLEFLFGKC